MEDRACQRCGETKPLAEFYVHTETRAPTNTCKGCYRGMKRAWTHSNPEKRAAHKAVERALLRGDLTSLSCERCGDAIGAHAHHDDYSRQLDVTWLCPKHHRERHRELRAAKEAA